MYLRSRFFGAGFFAAAYFGATGSAPPPVPPDTHDGGPPANVRPYRAPKPIVRAGVGTVVHVATNAYSSVRLLSGHGAASGTATATRTAASSRVRPLSGWGGATGVTIQARARGASRVESLVGRGIINPTDDELVEMSAAFARAVHDDTEQRSAREMASLDVLSKLDGKHLAAVIREVIEKGSVDTGKLADRLRKESSDRRRSDPWAD